MCGNPQLATQLWANYRILVCRSILLCNVCELSLPNFPSYGWMECHKQTRSIYLDGLDETKSNRIQAQEPPPPRTTTHKHNRTQPNTTEQFPSYVWSATNLDGLDAAKSNPSTRTTTTTTTNNNNNNTQTHNTKHNRTTDRPVSFARVFWP